VKVAYLLQKGIEIKGGAALCAAGLLRNLRDRFGHFCVILTPHPTPGRDVLDGIEIWAYRDLDELQDFVRLLRPDIVIGSARPAADAVRVGARFDLPVVIHVQEFSLSYPGKATRLSWGFIDADDTIPREEALSIVERADRIVVCSEYMGKVVREFHGRDSTVVHNFWRPDELRPVEPDCDPVFVGAVCGYRHKGSDMLLELADRFSDERFLLVGEPGSDLALYLMKEVVKRPNIAVAGRLTAPEMMARCKVFLVPSQLPEPFGRIAVEAMVLGVPTLASRVGGLAEIVGDGPQGVDDYRNADAWAAKLRELLDSSRAREHVARDGRVRAARFATPEGAAGLDDLLRELAASRTPLPARRVVTIHGARSGHDASALVNKRWSAELRSRGTVVHSEPMAVPPLHDVWIHHDYTEDFMAAELPDNGARVAVRTTDFGPMPPEWARRINDEFDELWAYTQWVVDQAVAGGVNPAKVHLVPLGVDTDVFRPDGDRFPLDADGRRVFLFVGGAVERKGIDILVRAYCEAFTADDHVCLVIKGDTSNAIYRERSLNEIIRQTASKPGTPKLILIDEVLPETDLAALYRTADVAVFPYRAEGFALPILEAMASGTPAVVPELGACRDFCTAETSFLVPSLRVRLDVDRDFALSLGQRQRFSKVDFCEIRPSVLRDLLRIVQAVPDEQLHAMALKGVRYARERFTWSRAVDRMEERFEALDAAEMSPRARRRRERRAMDYRKERAAVDLIVRNAERVHRELSTR
jgi:glycosyltransferase involved in cell wall biosynthesis